jgi:hypothetical protein
MKSVQHYPHLILEDWWVVSPSQRIPLKYFTVEMWYSELKKTRMKDVWERPVNEKDAKHKSSIS